MITTALLRMLNTNLARCTFDKKGAAPTVNNLSAKTGKVNWYVVLLAICVLKCYPLLVIRLDWTKSSTSPSYLLNATFDSWLGVGGSMFEVSL